MKSKFIAIVVLSVLPLVVACGGKEDQSQQRGNRMAAVPVLVGQAVKKDVPVLLRSVGTVEAFTSVIVKPQVSGRISNVYFTEGEEVRKGERLFLIDPRPYQAELAQAQANLARNRAQAENASQEVERYEDLVKKEYVTQQQYEQIKTNAQALQAAVRADQAAVETARLQLEYCSIEAPISGRTGRILVHPGNVVRDNESELVSISQVKPVRVRFSIPEQYLAQIRERAAAAQLTVEAHVPGQDKPVNGDLSFVDNAVDRQTGTILLKATFENKDGVLWPEQFVDVMLTLDTVQNATVVPAPAVQQGQEGTFVYVVKSDKTVEFRKVKVGVSASGETVIQNGVKPGETVVTDGQLRLVPGARVEVKASV